MIKMILALDQNDLLGSNNKLPWHYPEDLKYYNKLTKNKNILVGHNTYNSLINLYHSKMPYNHIYLASNDVLLAKGNITLVKDPALFLEDFPKNQELFVIGGKTIYKIANDFCDLIYLTRIKHAHEGDIYFHLNLDNFREINKEDTNDLIFYTYERIK